MGQILVVQVFNADKILANCNYYWGGYTCKSAQITKSIIDKYSSLKNETLDENLENDIFIKAIRILESTDASLQDEKEIKYCKEVIKKDDFIYSKGKEEGFICVTRESMEKSLGLSDITVNIDIKNETVDFQGFGLLSYKDYFGEVSYKLMEKVKDEKATPKMISKYIKKIEQYHKKGLISESDKDATIKELETGNYNLLEPKELKNVKFDLDFGRIPFNKFYRVVDLFEENSSTIKFMLNGDKNKIVFMFV